MHRADATARVPGPCLPSAWAVRYRSQSLILFLPQRILLMQLRASLGRCAFLLGGSLPLTILNLLPPQCIGLMQLRASLGRCALRLGGSLPLMSDCDHNPIFYSRSAFGECSCALA